MYIYIYIYILYSVFTQNHFFLRVVPGIPEIRIWKTACTGSEPVVEESDVSTSNQCDSFVISHSFWHGAAERDIDGQHLYVESLASGPFWACLIDMSPSSKLRSQGFEGSFSLHTWIFS